MYVLHVINAPIKSMLYTPYSGQMLGSMGGEGGGEGGG